MAIAEEFAGLDMEQLISAPLSAAVDAGVKLAGATADFIRTVGIDSDGNVRTASFLYEEHRMNQEGNMQARQMQVQVPLLAVTAVPNLQIDEVNLLFDMEVKHSKVKDSVFGLEANGKGGAGFGPAKVSVSGSVSAHNTNTRKSDYSAKYHVDIRAANHGTPEALSRVLDLMASSLVPVPVEEPAPCIPVRKTTKAGLERTDGNG